MNHDERTTVSTLLWILFLLVFCTSGRAATYDETTRGELSGDPTAPTPFLLTFGANTIIGSIGSGAGADLIDAFTITVPHGMAITSFVNTSVSGSQKQAFVGFQRGFSFMGSATDATAYVGLAHFGAQATNEGLGTPPRTPTSTVGVDLLPILNIEGRRAGASGFTPPLGQGAYTFLIGDISPDLENPKVYRFDFALSGASTPEPASVMSLLASATLMMRRQRHRSQTRPRA